MIYGNICDKNNYTKQEFSIFQFNEVEEMPGVDYHIGVTFEKL